MFLLVSKERIQEVKQKLGSTAFDVMAKEIPLEQVDWVKKSCKSPFKEEKTPSAYWFNEGNCLKDFSSSFTMDYIDYEMKYNNKSFVQAVKAMFDLAGEIYDENDFKESVNVDFFKNFKFVKDEPYSDMVAVKTYLNKRSISEKTIEHFNIKQNPKGDIAFQFYDLNGKLVQTKYRVSRPAKNGDFKWYWGECDVCPMLYGLDKVDLSKTLVITEGYLDALSVFESGFMNVVSIPGGASDSHWIDFNFDILEKCNDIILWFDDDDAGSKAVKDISSRLGIYKTRIVQSDPDIKESIKKYFSDYGVECDKIDANNVLVICGKEKVIELINNSKAIDNPKVKRLMDCEELQLQDMPKISTGFSSLDKVFWGNFLNSLTILTGKSGNGKSSILNTIFVAAPLEAGEKVFIYSGEIPNGILLGNIIKPLASRRHIIEWENPGKPNGYSVTKEATKAIKEYYKDSLFVYNDDNQFDTNSKSILESMEYSYRRYGVTNFIIDSLLTVDYSLEDGDDKYEKQKNFVIALKNFTNRNPVRVALVAHSRKLAAGVKEIGGDDIAGSSDIIKCCNRAFSVEILWDDPEGFNTSVRCIKDRETGQIEKEVKLFYDKKSYRIYSDAEELSKEYSWEKRFHIEYSTAIKDRIVSNIKDVKNNELKEVFGEV